MAEKGLTRNNLAEKGLTRCMLGNLSYFCFPLVTFFKFIHESMGPGWDRTRDPWNCCQTRICSQTCRVIHWAMRPGLPQCQPFWIQISSDQMSKRFGNAINTCKTSPLVRKKLNLIYIVCIHIHEQFVIVWITHA